MWKPSTENKSSGLSETMTRIPYEESSVYSRFDPLDDNTAGGAPPNLDVVLGPGDVLFVPKHWWHFVQTV